MKKSRYKGPNIRKELRRAAALSRFRKELRKAEDLAYDRSQIVRQDTRGKDGDLKAELDEVRQALVDFVHDLFDVLPSRYQEDLDFVDAGFRALKEAVRCTYVE